MGVLNVTPDSFSDGGKHNEEQAAVIHGTELMRLGAGIVDVGGESTRPGAKLIGPQEEQQRVLGVVRGLSEHAVPVSIDTINASTAKAAVEAGATMVNDVSGGLYDPQMLETMGELAATKGISVVLGHWRGVPDVSHARSNYDDVVSEVTEALVTQAELALAQGVPRENIYIDPGLGFDKDSDQGWQILSRIDELHATGLKVAVGVSRKRMLADIVEAVYGEPGTFADRDLATSVVTALAARAGVDMVRVHDVAGSAQALEVLRHFTNSGDRS